MIGKAEFDVKVQDEILSRDDLLQRIQLPEYNMSVGLEFRPSRRLLKIADSLEENYGFSSVEEAYESSLNYVKNRLYF